MFAHSFAMLCFVYIVLEADFCDSFTHILRGWFPALRQSHGFQVRVLKPLQWRHNERDGVSNHQPRECLLKRLFRRGSKITSKLRVTGICQGNSPVTSEFPAQMATNAKKNSIWWRHHATTQHSNAQTMCLNLDAGNYFSGKHKLIS